MTTALRRSALQAMPQLALLLLALNAFVAGLSGVVRGAETSAFLPAALPAVLLGWWLGRTRLKPWQSLGGLMLLGGLLVWGRTAQSGAAALLLTVSISMYLLENFLHIQGFPAPVNSTSAAAAEAAIQSLLAQSSAVWARVEAWLAGLRGGAEVNDPVVRVLVWSLLLWLLAAWAGWEVGRNRPLNGLVPGLAVLAAITKYTNADATALWVMAVSLLGLVGLARFEANLRRWTASRLDYAEIAVSNTMLAGVFVTLALAALGYVLPMISVKDFLESFRRHDATENQTARSLGLEAAREPVRPVPGVFTPIRAPGLPNNHLLGSGPELSREVVFTVRTGELPSIPVTNIQNIAPRHYWRSYSFDVYTGAGWVSSQVESIDTPPGEPLYAAPPGYRLLTQKFELKHGEEGSLFWSGSLYRSDKPFEAAWRTPPGQSYPLAVDPFRGADLYGAVNSSAAYQVESLILQASEAQLREASRVTPDFIQRRYTNLPPRLPERVYALARELTSTAATPYDEARAIESYLRANYPYNLDVPLPPSGADVADYFLFDLKEGYCDYYATAMVVLARSVGLPARLVMGYASGTYNPPPAEYIVSAADAHAWVEIYFPGFGWVEFEPTAGQPEVVRSAQDSNLSPAEPASAQQWDRLVRSVYGLPPFARWVIFVLAGFAGLAGLFILLEGWLLSLARPTFALRWMYRSIYRQAKRLAGTSAPGQTASEFAEGLQTAFKKPDQGLNILTSFYLQALFSPWPVQKTELYRAIRAWHGLRWKLFWTRKTKKPPADQSR